MRFSTLILLSFLTISCGGGGDGGGSSVGGVKTNESPVKPNLTLQAVYDFSHQSSCSMRDITKEVLSLYTDKANTQFELRKADDSVYLSGSLPKTKVITYTETVTYSIYDPVKKDFNKGSAEAACYMEIQETDTLSQLHAHCRLDDPPVNCQMYWY
jgi:hypothetical protein